MKQLFYFSFLILLASCSTSRLAPFSSQIWYVDEYSGNAVSDRGMELGFGSEWMVCDTTLIQSAQQIELYPELEKYLVRGITEFPEIAVDSILLYNPARGLLFTTYHQVKPLKPTTEVSLYNDSIQVYSVELAKIFGQLNTYIEDGSWEAGPINTTYTNVRYKPGEKQMVLLQRIPFRDWNIAIFQICKTKPKHNKWWPGYPIYPYWNLDLGNPDNIEHLAIFLQCARTTAVANLQLGIKNLPKTK